MTPPLAPTASTAVSAAPSRSNSALRSLALSSRSNSGLRPLAMKPPALTDSGTNALPQLIQKSSSVAQSKEATSPPTKPAVISPRQSRQPLPQLTISSSDGGDKGHANTNTMNVQDSAGSTETGAQSAVHWPSRTTTTSTVTTTVTSATSPTSPDGGAAGGKAKKPRRRRFDPSPKRGNTVASSDASLGPLALFNPATTIITPQYGIVTREALLSQLSDKIRMKMLMGLGEGQAGAAETALSPGGAGSGSSGLTSPDASKAALLEKLRQRNQLDLNTISHFPYGFDASMNTSGANNANALQQMMAMQQAMAMGMTGTSPNGMQPMFMMPMASPGGTAAGQQHPFFFMPTSAGDAAQNFGASVQQQQQQQQMMISPTLMQQFVDANQQPRQNDVLQDEHGEKDVPMTPMTEMAMAAFGRSSTALASGKPSRTSRRHTKTAAVTAPSSNNAPYSTRRSSYMTSAPFTAGTLFEEGISAWGTSTEGGLNLVDMGGSGDDGDVAGTPTRSLTFQY